MFKTKEEKEIRRLTIELAASQRVVDALLSERDDSGSGKELRRLKLENDKQKGRMDALIVEREFWVEQGRSLQNQLQTWQRMYAGLFDQLGRGVVTEESIAENLAMAAEELRQPVTTVEAVRALTSQLKGDTQGAYTSVGSRTTDRAIDREASTQRLTQGDEA